MSSPGQARWQPDHCQVDDGVPSRQLVADLAWRAVGGELVQDDLRAGAPETGRLPVLPEGRNPVGQSVNGDEEGEPAVGQLGGGPGGAVAHGREPDGQVGGGRLAEAERPCPGRGVEQGALTGQEGADLARDPAQLVGRVGEAGVVDPLTRALVLGPSPSTKRPPEGRWRVAAVIASVPGCGPRPRGCRRPA
jgi:hypothetical protein